LFLAIPTKKLGPGLRLWIIISLLPLCLSAQTRPAINWLDFDQLDEALATQNRPVLLVFYTDWCRYCKKLDREVFTDTSLIALVNKSYHAVRFNAETRDTVNFDGQLFYNRQALRQRNGIHQLAELLATRSERFNPPVLLMLDRNFRVTQRYFRYLSSSELMAILRSEAASATGQ
jgi:thioredoxin-related protein